jgi:hypothetical protein
MTLARFPLGQIVATPGAIAALTDAGDSPASFLRRHVVGDWGEIDNEDRQENERSISSGCRLLSAYTTSTGIRIWVITEADRSATTLLRPEEY